MVSGDEWRVVVSRAGCGYEWAVQWVVRWVGGWVVMQWVNGKMVVDVWQRVVSVVVAAVGVSLDMEWCGVAGNVVVG